MIHHVEKVVFSFLSTLMDKNQLKEPLLLGLSGGPDSRALLYLLLQFFKAHQIDKSLLILAHIDHKWRPESTQEALYLKDLAKELGISIYIKTLNDPTQAKNGNLEDMCRQERLRFFKEIYDQQSCAALILGHHADDQTETVLKRLFEGAALYNLSGLKKDTINFGMRIIRPFHEVRKKDILDWLEENKIEYFTDYTNLDSKYLRGRMRTQILPYLTEVFGKQVDSSLYQIGEEADELKSYLSNKIKPYLDRCVESKLGLFFDSSSFEIPYLELKYFLKQLSEKYSFTLSKEVITKIHESLVEGYSNKAFSVGHNKIQVDRKKIFFLKNELLDVQEIFDVKPGKFTLGSWNVMVEECSTSYEPKKGLGNVWQGEIITYIPKSAGFSIGKPNIKLKMAQGGSLNDYWTDSKVPAFLRSKVPVIYSQDTITEEFLTNKTTKHSASEYYKVVLTI